MQTIQTILKFTKKVTVLYIEDENDIRTTTKELLKIYFKSVDTAVDGKDGLNKYIKNNHLYDLIITDIQMPNLCGLEMSEKILKLNQAQHIIFITAYNEFEKLHKSINLGIDGYLTKPIDNKKMNTLFLRVSKTISHDKFIYSNKN